MTKERPTCSICVTAGRGGQGGDNPLVRVDDTLLASRPSLARWMRGRFLCRLCVGRMRDKGGVDLPSDFWDQASA